MLIRDLFWLSNQQQKYKYVLRWPWLQHYYHIEQITYIFIFTKVINRKLQKKNKAEEIISSEKSDNNPLSWPQKL